MSHIHFIGIGGIGVSALARYFLAQGCTISGSDSTDSDLLQELRNESMTITIGHSSENIPHQTDIVIYSEALVMRDSRGESVSTSPEWNSAREKWLPMQSYPEAIAEIFNTSYGIAIAGTHGKSTTTAMLGVVLSDATTIVGTRVPQLDGKNVHVGTNGQFVLETCEYRQAFLKYSPRIAIITNIDFDHPDSYRDLDDYRTTFDQFLTQVSDWIVLCADDSESLRLNTSGKNVAWVSMKERRWWIERSGERRVENGELKAVKAEAFSDAPPPLEKGGRGDSYALPALHLQVPGDHLLTDAYLAFVAAQLAWLPEELIIERLESYRGAWRRSELVKTTEHGNLLFSDYGHHPSEIRPTLKAFKEKYSDRKLVIVFQPHQYARTIGLLADFKAAFDDADTLIIPNIYFSRDTAEDVLAMPPERFVSELRERYPDVIHSENFEKTAALIRQMDQERPGKLIIILLGAGDVDDLREMIG